MKLKVEPGELHCLPLMETNVAPASYLCTFAHEEGWGLAGVESALNSPSAFSLLGYFEGAPAVFCTFTFAAQEANLNLVVTAPEMRRKGFAGKILQQAFCALSAKGVQEVYLEVRAASAGARALYEKLGFVQTGLRKNFYENPTDDAVVMKKELGGSAHVNTGH